jgi:hypothetical protein
MVDATLVDATLGDAAPPWSVPRTPVAGDSPAADAVPDDRTTMPSDALPSDAEPLPEGGHDAADACTDDGDASDTRVTVWGYYTVTSIEIDDAGTTACGAPLAKITYDAPQKGGSTFYGLTHLTFEGAPMTWQCAQLLGLRVGSQGGDQTIMESPCGVVYEIFGSIDPAVNAGCFDGLTCDATPDVN